MTDETEDTCTHEHFDEEAVPCGKPTACDDPEFEHDGMCCDCYEGDC